jgi:hypothetical protein
MPDYFLGLDLGQAADPTALAVLAADEAEDPRARTAVRTYTVCHLHRWHLGTRYPAIVEDLAQLLARPPQAEPPYDEPPLAGSVLAVDATGVGRAVVEMFEEARLPVQLRPLLITSGHQETCVHGTWHVAKKALVSCLQVLLQARRLFIVPGLEHTKALTKELENFRVKVTAAANETFEAVRQNLHDDLVLAVAMAAWMGESEAPGGGVLPFGLGKGRGGSYGRPDGLVSPTRPFRW